MKLWKRNIADLIVFRALPDKTYLRVFIADAKIVGDVKIIDIKFQFLDFQFLDMATQLPFISRYLRRLFAILATRYSVRL